MARMEMSSDIARGIDVTTTVLPVTFEGLFAEHHARLAFMTYRSVGWASQPAHAIHDPSGDRVGTTPQSPLTVAYLEDRAAVARRWR